ncbi:hypothetical protein BT63DRAFT_437618 [Microthyrium microscopicum]|uniref:CUE domain-containing protein n=1 Tax=Microthyrium microscopicum TaxID=703497 RepID=A0A6A6UL54_9PEZI|nr:hypothetical protein BT63DRAFT_437618 [Microthyrium microscopicum]
MASEATQTDKSVTWKSIDPSLITAEELIDALDNRSQSLPAAGLRKALCRLLNVNIADWGEFRNLYLAKLKGNTEWRTQPVDPVLFKKYLASHPESFKEYRKDNVVVTKIGDSSESAYSPVGNMNAPERRSDDASSEQSLALRQQKPAVSSVEPVEKTRKIENVKNAFPDLSILRVVDALKKHRWDVRDAIGYLSNEDLEDAD